MAQHGTESRYCRLMLESVLEKSVAFLSCRYIVSPNVATAHSESIARCRLWSLNPDLRYSDSSVCAA